MQPGEGFNRAQKEAWVREFGVNDPDAAAKLPWQFVKTWQACHEKPTWDLEKKTWIHKYWTRSPLYRNGSTLSVRMDILKDRTVSRDCSSQLISIQREKEPETWPWPPGLASASTLTTQPATHSTDDAQYVELRVVQGAYTSALLQITAQIDSHAVRSDVQQVVEGSPLTTNTGPFFAHLWFEDGLQGWELDKLKLYIGKTPYHENNEFDSASAILGTDQSAPLADLFRGNQMLDLPDPIVTKVNAFTDVQKSTISVQAFADESKGYNYNWRFVWARFRAAERANEELRRLKRVPEDKELRFR